MKFSILVVSLNPGDKLKKTIDSIIEQSFADYEIVVKDGGSRDGSIETLPEHEKLRLVTKKDSGIYDAMNQAMEEAKGEFLYFLNCGDYFADADALKRVADYLEKEPQTDIAYGNILDRLTQSIVKSNPHIDAFACYRNVPCHQACLYRTALVKEHPFSLNYKVRADYEQFLWCFFKVGAKTGYVDSVIASYEGGGFSETAANRKRSAAEHKEITKLYMTKLQLIKYKMIMILTLSKVRTFLSHSPYFGKAYNKVKSLLYKG